MYLRWRKYVNLRTRMETLKTNVLETSNIPGGEPPPQEVVICRGYVTLKKPHSKGGRSEP